MRRKIVKYLILISLFLLQSGSAFAGCYVEDGTFYSKDKHSMMTFAMAMDQGNRQKALQMVDDGRIKSCSQASTKVIERLDTGFVHADIAVIGKVWIYETFLHCN